MLSAARRIWPVPDTTASQPVPRGRHAPPLQVRLDRQRDRLFAAAAVVFAKVGYADASAEAISREAGMSKATFYEHFANKEDCIVALFDESARGIARDMREIAARDYRDQAERLHAGVTAFVGALTRRPALAQTVLVETVGAGPRTMERRDAVLQSYADWLYADAAANADRYRSGTYVSPDDAFAVIGAIFELVSRQLRTGRPADPSELIPVIERSITGALQPPA
jgi:AcrR family transcriptional regulator